MIRILPGLIAALGGLVAVSAVYQPGTPGAAWTNQELKETKQKIRWIIDNPVSASSSNYYYLIKYAYIHKDLDAVLPTPAKFIRLGFHDCLVEPDTGAGCNGCLNFHGMLNEYRPGLTICKNPTSDQEKATCKLYERGLRPQVQAATDNNNLFMVASILENVYKSQTYGGVSSGQSLYETGKSRADLWAFAALVAVQATVENNNNNLCPTHATALNIDCPLEQTDVNFCAFDLTNSDFQPKFKSGRSDCVPSCGAGYPDFCTSAKENHPSPHGNGKETVEFMQNNFNVNVQEVVGLFGAHSVGKTHKVNSMFNTRPWTPQGVQDWNNLYYINGVNYITRSDPTNSKNCYYLNPAQFSNTANGFTGDEHGNALSVKFKVKSEKMTANGGPWNWVLFARGCSRDICGQITDRHPKSCCHLLDYCDVHHPHDCPIECMGSECAGHTLDLHVNMLNVDMGFVFNFTTNSDGRPQGCTGLDDPNWNNNLAEYSGEVECGLNLLPSDVPQPPGRNFFSEYEFYAKNPRNWLKTFTRAFDIMLENRANNLKLESSCWFNDSC